MSLPFLLGAGVLIALLIYSVHLAYSGILVGRAYIGWIFILAYMLIYFPFSIAWYRNLAITSVTVIVHVIFLVLLIFPLGALITETIVETFMPDRSGGLKLAKVYTEAEKKAVADDLAGAIVEYEKIIADDPDELRARIRMAELCAEAGQHKKAAVAYEAVLERWKELSREQHCSVLTRLSELYSKHLRDNEKARIAVQLIIDKYPDTDYADFAKERLNTL